MDLIIADALWDDEKAGIRSKKIMDLFEEEGKERFSFEIKEAAGFKSGGEKNFEGTITSLQMQTYLCVAGFEQRLSKKGTRYGMKVACYAMPETIFGSELVRSAYSEDPCTSGKRIVQHMLDAYPIATEGQIRKILGGRAGVVEKREREEKRNRRSGKALPDILKP